MQETQESCWFKEGIIGGKESGVETVQSEGKGEFFKPGKTEVSRQSEKSHEDEGWEWAWGTVCQREREREQREEKWANRSLTLTVLSTEFSWWPLMKYGSCRGGAHTDRPTDGWEDAHSLSHTHTHTRRQLYQNYDGHVKQWEAVLNGRTLSRFSEYIAQCALSLCFLQWILFLVWDWQKKQKNTIPSNWMCELCKWQQKVYLMQMSGNENPFSTCFSESITQLPFWYKPKSPFCFYVFTPFLWTYLAYLQQCWRLNKIQKYMWITKSSFFF